RERADVIIVTKSPVVLPQEKKHVIKGKLKTMPFQEVYFTSIAYQSLIKAEPKPGGGSFFPVENLKGYHVVLFTGIANTQPLEDYLVQHGIKIILLPFPDHHAFSESEIRKIIRRWEHIPEMNKLIVTTEKDWRRLQGTVDAGLFTSLPLYFLPIEVQWDAGEKLSFDEKIIQYVEEHQGKR